MDDGRIEEMTMNIPIEQEVLELCQRRIAARIKEQVRPICDRIVDEEVATVALNVSRYVNITNIGSERLVIEIRKPEVKP